MTNKVMKAKGWDWQISSLADANRSLPYSLKMKGWEWEQDPNEGTGFFRLYNQKTSFWSYGVYFSNYLAKELRDFARKAIKATGADWKFLPLSEIPKISDWEEATPWTRAISIELETSNCPEARNIERYFSACRVDTTRDSSIEGEHTAEFRIGPMSIKDMRSVLKVLLPSLEAAGVKVNESCGLHVHVDIRDFGYSEIKRMISSYLNREEEFYSDCAEHRQNNRFCMKGKEFYSRLNKGKGTFEFDALQVTGPYFRQYERAIRYYGMNLFSYLERGSVEFRMKEATFDVDEVLSWISKCEAFVSEQA